MIDIFVPTYKRKQPAILSMLDKDKNIRINLCVRAEDYNSGFYSHLANLDRVHVIPIGEYLTDIGVTRQAILNYCVEHNIEYCVMFDDGITNVKNLECSASISECIRYGITRLKTDKLSKYAFMYTFYREGMRYVGVHKDDKYFVGLSQQAYIIDVEKCVKYDLAFKSLKICGIEDIAFLLDGIKQGLITLGDTDTVIEGKMPNEPSVGGNHKSLSSKDLASRYDIQHSQLEKYVGPIYGMSLEKKYRKSLNEVVTYAILNYTYFRDVLVFNRDLNQEIIALKFKKF